MDDTSVVTGCRQLEAGAPAPGTVNVTNLNGFDSVRFDWVDTTCEGPINAEFQTVAGGYKLALQQPSVPCLSGGPTAIAVDYLIPMPRKLVVAGIEFLPPGSVCADTPFVTVVDEAGVVRSCAASQTTVTPADGDLAIENPGGDTSALKLSWIGSRCIYDVYVLPSDPYLIAVYVESNPCPLGDLVHSVTIELTTPIRADQIIGWSFGGPPRTPSPSP